MKHTYTSHRLRPLILFGALVLSVASCQQAVTATKRYDEYKSGDNVETLGSIELDLENAMFDDFTNGVNYDRWMIGSGAWGQGNGGVVPENVFYTEDGTLVLRGNGRHYARGEVRGLGELKDGRNTGSVVISKFKTRPGHYEVKMKPLPRLGACTAFWTYTNRLPTIYEENDNHEIDIELPGGKSNSLISFKNVLNTNYVTEKMNISKDVVVKDITGEKTINLADGKFHTFGFDWYTDPSVVIYFIDGYITAINDLFVPTLETYIWLGNWFPNNTGFVGDSNFETDYMLVDWVKYIPFKSQPYEPWNPSVSVNPAQRSQYPSSPIVLPEANMISNGDFDALYDLEDRSGRGWTFSKLNGYGDKDVDDICYLGEKDGYDSSVGAVLKEGGYLSSVVDTIYDGFKYNLSFMAKTDADDARVIITYRDATQTTLSRKTIKVTGNTFKEYTEELVPPEGTYSVFIQIYANDHKELSFVLDEFKITRGF